MKTKKLKIKWPYRYCHICRKKHRVDTIGCEKEKGK